MGDAVLVPGKCDLQAPDLYCMLKIAKNFHNFKLETQ